MPTNPGNCENVVPPKGAPGGLVDGIGMSLRSLHADLCRARGYTLLHCDGHVAKKVIFILRLMLPPFEREPVEDQRDRAIALLREHEFGAWQGPPSDDLRLIHVGCRPCNITFGGAPSADLFHRPGCPLAALLAEVDGD